MVPEGNGGKITPENVHIHVSYLRKQINDLVKDIEDNYVRKEEYNLVRAIAFGFVSIVMAGVVSSILYLAVRLNG